MRLLRSLRSLAMTIKNHKWGWVKETIPIFILIILTCIFFSEILFGNKIFIHRDLLRFFYPLREFSINQFWSLKIPLWNPYIHCGSAHLAELQTCVFYPLSIIYLLFSYPQAFNYFIIFHIFLAGLFTYILMRNWNHSRYASFLSATVFMFSGYIISVINLLASLASIVWLPLVILFYERALKGEWFKNSIITGVFMALMFLGGEPSILYAMVFILMFMPQASLRGSETTEAIRPEGSLRGVPTRVGIPKQSQRLLRFARNDIWWTKKVMAKGKCLALALLVAVGLSCFQILPFLEFVKYSSRGAMDFTEASMWSLPPYALLDLLVPYLSESDYLYKDYWTRQSWLMVYYMGIFTLICAFISLKFDTTRRRKAFFYILALGLVLSFGRYTPLYYFLYKIMPGFSLQRYPVKFFFIVAFSLAVLAGMGLDYYRNNMASIIKFLKTMLIFAFISGFFYLVINLNFFEILNSLYSKVSPYFLDKKYQLNQLTYVAIFNIKRAIGFFIILSVLMFLGARKKIRLNLVILFLLFVSLLDIYTGNKKLYLNMDIDDYLKPGHTVSFLKKDRDLFRIFESPSTLSQNMYVPERDYFEGVDSLKERMVSNRGVSFGIYDAYGYGSLYNERHEDIIIAIVRQDLPDRSNLLNLLNVKYVISPKDFEAEGYEMVRKGEKTNIYENKNFLPRAFLVDKAVVIKDGKKILERLKSKDFDPSKEVILEEAFGSTIYDIRYTIYEKANIIQYTPNKVTIEAQVSTPKFLVLSDSYYPGWKAYVDGRRAKIYRADYTLRAVHLKPGKHIVTFTYDPFSFKIGMIITLVTLGALGIFLWIRR